ncbi:MAG: hypothetical protein HW413_2046 [Thermoleophilia bacterium]|nr:hypothetical protein [Thermoleophilia bacterium]
MGLLLVGAAVEEVLDLPQLAVASHERRLEPLRLELSAQPGDDALRLPEWGQSLLALELEGAGVLVDDRLLRRAPRGLAHVHRARVGGRLHAGGGVDQIARDHALAFGADRDGSLAGQHSCSCAQLGSADLVAERGNGGHQVERGANRALRVVLGRGRCPPDRHHGVPDELLDGTAVELDQASGRVEVAREELARVFGVALLGRCGEPDQVGEENGDEAALRGRSSLRGRRRRRSRCRERSAALPAELDARSVWGATRRAREREARSALAAELPTGLIC